MTTRYDKRRRSKPSSTSLHPSLKKVFQRIGVPSQSPFKPDEFQLEALRKLRSGDVLVSTPTGAGKTWIAIEAIRYLLSKGKRSWYTAPLKALSNSKYEEFCQLFGESAVGIVTGDRKENTDAPVVVGTTEILRNQLYDAMYFGSDIGVDFVVLDEAHYLSDAERGVVWEEILIYLPPRVKVLLLSATFQNAQEIAQWLSEMRNVPCQVVTTEDRPVPLVPVFLFPDGSITPLSDHSGLLPQIKEFLKTSAGNRRYRSRQQTDYGAVVEHLRTHNLLPAIFFLKSRSDCDAALESCVLPPARLREDEVQFLETINTFLEKFPFLRQHRQLSDLKSKRVGSHHGGQLPQWKLLIEKLMNFGFMTAIFSTSTVAAGVDFPARTVVLVQSDRYNGKEFTDLTATELHQMTGRAGRRGKDKIGFALIVPGVFQNPALIEKLFCSPPEPIRSQIQANFSMTLNLLLSFRPPEIRQLLDRSLATFQGAHPQVILKKQLDKQASDILPLLSECPQGATAPEAIQTFIQQLKSGEAEQILCTACNFIPLCQERRRKRVKELSSRVRKLARRIDRERHKLWLNFEQHLFFLKETGFVTADDYLTADGVWASQLRLDQPLLIAESIRQNVFELVNPEILTALIATFVSDRTKSIEVNLARVPDSQALIHAFETMVIRLQPLRSAMLAGGFFAPPMQLWPAAALYLWARGFSWLDLLDRVEVEEGDLAMLILRTADHLRQVRNLEASHTALAAQAHHALPLILREPVWGY